MITHLFKLIWNQKRKNVLLILEIFVSFLVLFGVLSLLLYQYQNYKQPLGFDYKNIWVANLDLEINRDSSNLELETALRNQIEAFPEVEKISFSNSNIPFSMSSHNSGFSLGEINTLSNIFAVDEYYAEVMGIEMLEGHWYTKADYVGKYDPVVITQRLKVELFGEKNALDQIVMMGERELKVTGVIDYFKYRDFEDVQNSAFVPFKPNNVFEVVLLLKMRPDVNVGFEPELARTISAIIKGRQNEIEQLAVKKEGQFQLVLIPMIILLIVCSFLIFNVILGLFGILWYNINKRRNEIGLRRALGATQRNITSQFIGEILFIATLGILLGSFFAAQFPILQVFGLSNSVYLKAILLAGLLIYGIVIICAFYPSRQASKIHPALALHQN